MRSDGTTAVAKTANSLATLKYLTPYSGAILAEYFMYRERVNLIYILPSEPVEKKNAPKNNFSILRYNSPWRDEHPIKFKYTEDCHGNGSGRNAKFKQIKK
ncbi:hypothetical protein NE237_026650 [Protea cynaroides]|uniref:Uncharacterized protein n=1 Tax=Protea cynaroides TaxID=273540 RepID=A0A9Q0K0Q0_9MAGN|nr:hypothetical protein NE237_026650 [Protea cynaroides]